MCAPGFELWHHSGEANGEGRAAMESLIPSPPSVLKAALPASHHIPSRECGCSSIDGAVSLLLPGPQRSDRCAAAAAACSLTTCQLIPLVRVCSRVRACVY